MTPASKQLAELWFCLLVLKQLTEAHFTEAQSKIKIKPRENVPLHSEAKWGESACDLKECIQMKCINLIIYQLAVSCGVGQGFCSPILNTSRDRMKITCCVCCYLITDLMANSQNWCATADVWTPSGFYSSCQFFCKDKEEIICRKQNAFLRVFYDIDGGIVGFPLFFLTHPVQ